MLVADQVTQDLGDAKVVFVPGDSAADDGEFVTLKNTAYDTVLAKGDLTLEDLRAAVYAARDNAKGSTPASTPGLVDRDVQGPSDFNDNARSS